MGCSAGMPGFCDGQITSCSPIFNEEACINAGCQYDSTFLPPCGGTMANPCSQLDRATCLNLQSAGAGCTWTEATPCSGTLSCPTLSNTQCGAVTGCSLQ
jgi:hypothetical protein